jgi:hypothetical protein
MTACSLDGPEMQRRLEEKPMQEPGLDNRHRDQNGQIERKRSDAINKNLPNPIPEFSPNATVGYMRKETGKVGLNAIRQASRNR